jgi:hypothetical protein
MSEQFDTSSKKPVGRGLGRKSLDLIEAMYPIIEAAQPITGRGVGYKLFTASLSPSMSTPDMQRVYRLLKEARERGIIPWEWIVDETRSLERTSSWSDAQEYADVVMRSYRRDYWNQQPFRIEVWSEKGTVRGVLKPVLGAYGVGFRVMHGFGSATAVHDVAEDDDGRQLIALYVGDWDPSGLFMSECDLRERLFKYQGDHVVLSRVALTERQLAGLPSFSVADKRKDPRYRWFVENFGNECWELDALDPNDLRACVEQEINEYIEPAAWSRCKVTEAAERESIIEVMNAWKGRGTQS